MKSAAQSVVAAAAFLAAASLFSSHANAQYRVGNDGHALDSNNRIGGGGYNEAGGGSSGNAVNGVTGNDIVYKDVTGLAAFQGRIPYSDPFGFTGRLPGEPSVTLDQIAGGFGTTAGGQVYTSQPREYYSDQRGTPPPPGFMPAGTSGGYVPAPPGTEQPQDLRLGNTLDVPVAPLPTPGELNGPGPVNTALYSSSPFIGRSTFAGASLDNTLDNGFTAGSTGLPGNELSPFNQRLSSDEVLRLRQELNGGSAAAKEGTAPLGQQPSDQPQAGDQPAGPEQPQQQPFNMAISNSVGAPTPGDQARPLGNGPYTGGAAIKSSDLSGSARVRTGRVSSAGVNTGESQRRVLPGLPPPQLDNSQYGLLRQRYQQFQAAHPQTDEQANQNYQAWLRERRRLTQGGDTTGAGGAKPAGQPTGQGTHESTVIGVPSQPGNPSLQTPVPIGPVAQGIEARGLRDLLEQGETLARQQRFKEAISKFREAQQVAPNDSLIQMDLANAELGAGYYQRAEQDIRAGFTGDPALLMGTYDLKGLIGDDRLQVLIADLKQLAVGSNNETPVILLAYLSYNTGNAAKAVEYLDQAEQRAGGQDDLIRQLRDHWALPTNHVPDVNK